jgi:hypothetical protein
MLLELPANVKIWTKIAFKTSAYQVASNNTSGKAVAAPPVIVTDRYVSCHAEYGQLCRIRDTAGDVLT